MSLYFSDTTNKNGLLQEIESECGFDDGGITGNTTLLKKFTNLVNLGMDDYMSIAIQASGRWQFDDSNHTKDPIITTNLVSAQRDYHFTVDEQSNLILDIYKVAILPTATATLYQSIEPIDELNYDSDIVTGSTTGGVPYGYGKLGNGIFLEPRPNYSATSGLKIFINRESYHFLTSDTNTRPGIPGIHHRYLVLKASLDYARRNNLASYNRILDEVASYEGNHEKGVAGSIAKYFGLREKDMQPVLVNEPIIFE